MQLLELKKEFEKCKIDCERYHHLLDKREIESHKIHELKEAVETKLIQMHRLIKNDPQRAHALKNAIEEQTEEISQLKAIIKHIDEELDQIGDEKEALLEKLHAKLIQNINNNYPEAKQEYESINAELQKTNVQKLALLKQKELIAPLFDILKEGEAIPQKGGFVSFLFGNSPRAALGRVMHNAAIWAEKIYPFITEEHIKNFLDKFLQDSKKYWNKDLYPGKFTEFYAELSQMMSELEERLQQSQDMIVKQEQAIDTWIEKYCKKT
jgi:exonuclease VII large subunit